MTSPPQSCRRMPVWHPAGGPLVALLAALALAAVPARGAPTALAPPPPPLPPADLSTLPAPVRRHAEELERAVVAALAAPDAAAGELAGGAALLGQLYHAYDLAAAAVRALDVAVTLEPGDPDILHRRGLARRDAGDAAGAAADFGAVVAAQPARTAAWLHLGHALLALGRPGEAHDAFAAAEELGARAAATYGLGLAALADGDAEAAGERLRAALSLQPSASVVHADLARAYERLGDAERAADHRARAGDVPFDDHDVVVAEIRRLRVMTSFSALRETAAAPGPFDGAAFLDFAVAELGAADGTVERLRAAVAEIEGGAGAAERAAERARLRLAIGGLLLLDGRGDEAIGELAAAVELDPAFAHARLQLAGALAQQGRYEAAVAHYDLLVTARPGDAVPLIRRAVCRLRLGDEAAARRDLERALAAAADPALVAEAQTVLGNLALAAGAGSEAAARFARAVEAAPDDPEALRGLGLAQLHAGRHREAAATLGRLVAVAPEDAAMRDAESVALILAGDEAAARARLEAAVAELPDEPRLAGRLARLLAAAEDHRVRDGARAVELAQEVFAVAPNADAVETLAMAHAEAGDFERAVVWQRRLLAAEADAPAADLERRRANLDRYESGRTCCAGQPTNDSGESR